MASTPGPPPATRDHGHTGVASVRLRRTAGLKPGESAKTVASNQDTTGHDSRQSRINRPRDLFAFQRPRREQLESDVTVAALQENVSALTLANKREKALSASLKEQVAQLMETLAKLNETREVEKIEHEKTPVVQKQKAEERILPEIHSGSTLAASTAALQQQTQMEVLSLENRCLHMTENNKKLLTMIQQLENAQNEAHTQLEALQQDNTRLLTAAENLNSTITSQSALIIGLRSTVKKLSRDEKQIENLRSTLERCQRKLETVNQREKILQEEHAKLKVSTSQEKEALMSKILDFQQRLQRSDALAGNVIVLETKIKQLQIEKEAMAIDLQVSNSRCDALQTRVVQAEKVLEEFVEVKRSMESERADLETMLNITRQELETCVKKLHEAEVRTQNAEKRNAGIQEMTDLLKTRDEEIETLMQKVMRLEDDVNERNQRHTGLQDELHKVNAELQGLKQLSHDETVQALQMARQKAATYEALTLLNDEKKALEEQLRLVQERLQVVQVALNEEKGAKEQILVVLDTHAQTIEELRNENMVLLEQTKNSQVVVDKVVANIGVQTVEELMNSETHAQTANELEDATTELQNLRSEFAELQGSHDELQEAIESLRQSQDKMEVGYKKTVSRERYKSESFQSQLKLLQNENGELSEKMESLCKDLMKKQQLNDAQMLEMTELKERVLSPEAVFLLHKTQDSLEQTVNSLLEAEHASESTFTCLQCMQLFTQPMTLAPCGHTYCAACLAKCGNVDVPSSISCKMCETGAKKETECIFPNYALADLTARFIFRQQSLASLTTMCLSLRNSFKQRSSNSHSTATLPIETGTKTSSTN
ncbi:Hypothetical protein PHPALM_37710 [Phytophthora palmivora]|uniref:RING-type domain-containing protein n=1 Tax=Phytophthora palmivora TaxID=4796 RepID=A0A2P4WWR3_9STRA|nr:Hypothetical protein PHPALM_37710 [Phytophthora palmivora]